MWANRGFLILVVCFFAFQAFAQKFRDEHTKKFDPATTKFALDLYREIANSKHGSENIFFSPLSIFTAFGMLKAGARGRTAAEMERAMNWKELGSDDGHSGIRRLLKNVFDPLEGNNTISIANKLWMQKYFCSTNCKNFIKTLIKNYKAGLESLNFVKSPEESRKAINQWVQDQTNDKIKDLMPAGSVNQATRFLLTNAIYFKSKWKNPFDKRDTQDGNFEAVLKDGFATKKVPLMYQNGRFFSSGFVPSNPYQLLELPYEDESLSMLVILPRSIGSLRNVEFTSNVKQFDQMLSDLYEFSETSLDVYLPKFKVSSNLKLKDYMTKIGMKDVFSPSHADLSGITGYKGLYVDTAVHKAYVNVDEEGTEAAAATGIGIALASLPFEFRVDKPFMFVIRHRATGTILFMGRVMDPSAE